MTRAAFHRSLLPLALVCFLVSGYTLSFVAAQTVRIDLARAHTPTLLTIAAVAPIGFDVTSTFIARAHTPPGYTTGELLLPDSPAVWVPIAVAQAVGVDWAARTLWRTGHRRWAIVLLGGVGTARAFAGIHNLRLQS